MRLRIDVDLDYIFPQPADVLLQIEVAALADQRIEAADLTIWSDHPIRAVPGEEGIGQRCWARGEGRLTARYAATVAIDRPAVDLAGLRGTPARDLPGDVIGYLLPSRYCESDRFEPVVQRRFGGLSGGALATALTGYVRDHLTYDWRGSTGATTACDTYAAGRGICRDYAHLLVALARAGEIPARCVAVYAPGVDPPDFHAVAEVWLDGGWHLIDATGMAAYGEIARVCVGRDATDIAFMTVFGEAQLARQRVCVTRIDETAAPLER